MLAPNPDCRQQGFTLLELLIAVAILALIAVGSYRLLAATITTRDQAERHMQALQTLQKADMILQRDLLQAVARPIRDAFGDKQPGLILSQDASLEFTRRGWRNPLQETRSQLVRVRYRVQGRKLVREHWRVLDRVRDSQPERTVLLENVDDFQIRVFADNSWSDVWPALAQSQKKAEEIVLPEAIELSFKVPVYGRLRRVLLLPETPSHQRTAANDAGDAS